MSNSQFFNKLTILILLNLVLIISLNAQYTLSSADVEINEEGVLLSCSKIFSEDEKHVIIPDILDGDTITAIDNPNSGAGIFDGQTIDTLVLPTYLETIALDAFKNAGLQYVDFTKCTHLKRIGFRSFYGNSIGDVDFSNCISLEVIEFAAFIGNKLSQLDLSNCSSLIGIDGNCFIQNKLKSINLPSNLQYLSYGCFGNNLLETINGKPTDGIIYKMQNGIVDSTYIISYGGAIKDIDFIPDSITGIAERAFAYIDITSFDFSNLKDLKFIDKGAFQDNELTSVDLSECTSLIEIKKDAFYSNNIANYTLPFEPTKPGHEFVNWKYDSGTVIELLDGKYTNSNLRSGCYAEQIELPKKITISIHAEDESPLSDAEVVFGDFLAKQSDVDGMVVYDSVYSGDYNYSVSAEGYIGKTGILTVVSEDISIDINLTIIGSGSTRLKENKAKELRFWPNPVENNLHVSSQKEIISLEVYSLDGQLLLSEQLLAKNSLVDLSSLVKGIYIIKATDSNNKIYKDMLIKK